MGYVLASASPRRRELLSLITNDFIIDLPQVEEICPDEIPPRDRPEYLARLKANEVVVRHPDDIVISADTAVFVDDRMLGKPEDREDACLMLRSLSGRTHSVITGCCIARGEERISFSVVTEVEFYPLTDAEIEEYVDTGEPFDKAGSYGIQGKGALLVREIRGDYFNVVGLPVAELSRRLKCI